MQERIESLIADAVAIMGDARDDHDTEALATLATVLHLLSTAAERRGDEALHLVNGDEDAAHFRKCGADRAISSAVLTADQLGPKT